MNQNLFTCKGRTGVSRAPKNRLDLAFFEKVEEKIREQGHYQLASCYTCYHCGPGKRFAEKRYCHNSGCQSFEGPKITKKSPTETGRIVWKTRRGLELQPGETLT